MLKKQPLTGISLDPIPYGMFWRFVCTEPGGYRMVLDSLLMFARVQERLAFEPRVRPQEPLGFALNGPVADVYNEQAFRHFLGVERTRAEQFDRPSLLLLVSLRRCPEAGMRVPRSVTSSLFTGLAHCVREVDFIGWYRDQRVAGAVLAQGANTAASDVPARIVERVTNTLGQSLPPTVARRLRVRVVQLGLQAK